MTLAVHLAVTVAPQPPSPLLLPPAAAAAVLAWHGMANAAAVVAAEVSHIDNSFQQSQR